MFGLSVWKNSKGTKLRVGSQVISIVQVPRLTLRQIKKIVIWIFISFTDTLFEIKTDASKDDDKPIHVNFKMCVISIGYRFDYEFDETY